MLDDRLSDEEARVPVSGGRFFALVDATDLPLVSRYTWHATVLRGTTRYAVTEIEGDGKRHRMLMHRLILSAVVGQFVDHVNGDGMDNRRCNLRFADHSRNQMNRHAKTAASGFKGVAPNGSSRRWGAYIAVDGHKMHLGVFADAETAALAYDSAARRHFGPFAAPNFPDRTPVDELVNAARITTYGRSPYRGVTFDKRRRKWRAQIGWGTGSSRRCRIIGYFMSEEEAARAYDSMAADIFGDRARLNFPEEVALLVR